MLSCILYFALPLELFAFEHYTDCNIHILSLTSKGSITFDHTFKVAANIGYFIDALSIQSNTIAQILLMKMLTKKVVYYS